MKGEKTDAVPVPILHDQPVADVHRVMANFMRGAEHAFAATKHDASSSGGDRAQARGKADAAAADGNGAAKKQVREIADVQKGAIAILRQHRRVAWFGRFNSGRARGGKLWFHELGMSGAKLSDGLGQMRDGRILVIEFKRPGETPDAAQQQFLDTVARWGGVSGWADSIERAIEIVESSCRGMP